MIGTAGLKGINVDCIVGVYPHERMAPQRLLVDVEIDYDFSGAVASDAIEYAVDYDRVAQAITGLLVERRFRLIETMAEEAASLILREVSAVHRIRLEIRKPSAVQAAACAFVRVERARA